MAKSDEELMVAYATGDQLAFRSLFERKAPLLLAMFRRCLRDDELAKDLLQQTFLNLHRARFDYQLGELVQPWLFTIARNLLRDHLARGYRKRELACGSEVLESLPSPETSNPEARHVAWSALQGLSADHLALVRAIWLDGRSSAELAHMQGGSKVAARVRVHRIVTKMRAGLQQADAFCAV